MANQFGLELFSSSSYTILPQIKSDHSPLFINIITFEGAVRQNNKLSCYEAAWQLMKNALGL